MTVIWSLYGKKTYISQLHTLNKTAKKNLLHISRIAFTVSLFWNYQVPQPSLHCQSHPNRANRAKRDNSSCVKSKVVSVPYVSTPVHPPCPPHLTAFPDLGAPLAALLNDESGLVLDGEIVPLDENGAIAAFQTLQTRLNRKKPGADVIAATPLAVDNFDFSAAGSR